jgi:probable rRNA maturation factor
MSLTLAVQVASTVAALPTAAELRRWANAALRLANGPVTTELVIRIVDAAESADLNQTYRQRSGPTNVLSFPCEPPPGIPVKLLGDLVICAPLVAEEAAAQQKSVTAHWAHLVIHGVLHLLGYDHENDPPAAAMESLEIRILAELGYPDPYRDGDDVSER